MNAMDFNIDDETTILANDLRAILGAHMLRFNKLEYHKVITSCLIALACEVGRLRGLAVSTGEVEEDTFDRVFKQGVMVHYNEFNEKYGKAN